ncbi:hypothetical protein [Vibrio nigripulchritudo]|uniref:hypothetical protein n=1 Tax=Vibrio nigripulchritudo TaxID=28173 RepID=UPI0003B20933|nr:hypothetical protein [Vibrio nigripulchritudo]CCN70090.1 conserved hypothetical protein [Vibrio nigripulchritudo SFn118]
MSNVNFVPYYQTFEQDIEVLSRYIEICEDNFRVYSVELTRLYLSICSEIDVIMKSLCQVVSPDLKPKNMPEYVGIIKTECSQIISHVVSCNKFDVSLEPWKLMENERVPSWWQDHNKVKHDRSENYSKANLSNVINALSALYVLNIYLIHESYYRGIAKDSWPDLSQTLTQTMDSFKLFRLNVPFAYLRDC